MDKRQNIIFTSTILLITSILIYGIYYLSTNDVADCRNEIRLLISQEINKTNSTSGGNCTDGCLFFKTLKVDSVDMLINYKRYEFAYEYLYFAGEQELRQDLDNGSLIVINWCNNEHGERVKGVSRYNK